MKTSNFLLSSLGGLLLYACLPPLFVHFNYKAEESSSSFHLSFNAQSESESESESQNKPQNATGYTNRILFLNETDPEILQEIISTHGASTTQKSPYSVDILIIGSKSKIQQAQIQLDTWASHPVVRHFIVSTEFDDTNPKCKEKQLSQDQSISDKELLSLQSPCHRKKRGFMEVKGCKSKLTQFWRTHYASINFLRKKANPLGWICAQRRFATSFTSVVQMYSETESLPDYLIIADDDTYINMEHIFQMLVHQPKQLEEKGFNQDESAFPTSETPVVWAGCKIRSPIHIINWTIPFGGYGQFFSKGALKRLIEPMHCNETQSDSGVHQNGSCQKLLHKEKNAYPMNATISEEDFFNIGDSLNQIFYKYSRGIEHFCLHSDWFFGYIVNFHNISRHTTPNTGEYWDIKKVDTEEDRLHSLPGSEFYRKAFGQCEFGIDKECEGNSTACHYVNSTMMSMIHSQAMKLRQEL